MISRPIVSSRIAQVTPPWSVAGWPFRPGCARASIVIASGYSGATVAVLWLVLAVCLSESAVARSGVVKSRSWIETMCGMVNSVFTVREKK